ncbi:MAG: hypothetical protein ABI600_08770 [Luteolibacter sp.]
MKNIYLYIMPIIAISQVMAQNDSSKIAIDAITQKASAGDIHGLIESLPDLERLWKDQPVAYFDAIKVSIPSLIKSGNSEAKEAALTAFPNLIAKTCPADTAAATAYIAAKSSTLGSYFSFKEIWGDKGRLLMIADFLSEVRTLRIPNYQNQGTNMPGREILEKAGVHEVADLPTQAQKDAVATAVKKNEEDMKMNELQGFLSSADYSISSYLMTYAKNFPVKDPANRQFYQELAKRAKFTEEEVKTLHTPR